MVDPQKPAQAGESRAAEGAGQVRAWLLGSAGQRILIACPCGARRELSRRHFQHRGFTICDRCKAAIFYASLEVVPAAEATARIGEIIRQAEEREAARDDLEHELRLFVATYDTQPEWLWAPATRRLVGAVRQRLELLGGPVEGGGVWAAYYAQPERQPEFEQGGGYGEYDEDEEYEADEAEAFDDEGDEAADRER